MQKKSILAIVAGVGLGVGLAWAGAAEGKPVYTAKCQGCHGPTGEAKETIAKALKVTMLHLGSKEVQALSDAEMKDIITKGKGKMKGVAGLSAKQVDDVVAYTRTLKQ